MAKNKQHIYIPLTEEEWQFIQDHVTVEQRVKLWMAQAEKNAGCTLEQLKQQKIAQEQFYAQYRELTKGLSEKNDQLLTLGLPMTCNADSTDVEHFIVNVWSLPVTDDNYVEVGHAFKRWFKEAYPHEYATPETMMFNRWR